MQIQGHSFLVSGAASGLGAACAKHLSALGANLILLDRNSDQGQALSDTLGDKAWFVQCDVTQETEVSAAVDTALAHSGALHGVIHCAGIGVPEKILSDHGPHSLNTFTRTLDVNLIGSFNLLRYGAAAMAKGQADEQGERGIIINTASIAAFEGQIGQLAYAAAKGGIVAMTLPAARELARHGIRVMCIAPGLFDTPMLAGLDPEVRQALGEQIPFPSRLGQPHEFAALVQHIIENTMLNGETLRLDGALRMPPK